jgi:peptidoglycan-associated lipoprotein
MVRKRMAWVILPILVLVFTGCPKKKPEPPPKPIAMDSTPMPEPAPVREVEQPKDVATDMVETDPLDSEDLREVNMEAERQGFSANVYFEFDQSDLRDEARQKLAANARFLTAHPEFVLTIEGHCDERGTNEYNLALGERRANTAKDYLASLGVAANRLHTISYGEERPVCTESTEACWQRNRRDHMVITGRM